MNLVYLFMFNKWLDDEPFKSSTCGTNLKQDNIGITTPGRQQSKMLILSTNVVQK